MFHAGDRERIRSELLEAARADARLTGGAVTGSAAAGNEDRWSDVDLAFGVGAAAPIREVLSDWTRRMYERYEALHHLDVMAGEWIYRVFLLASTLQVDLAFVPAGEFGARAPTFRLMFGRAAERPQVAAPAAESLIGYGWLYAIHARSCLARGRLWQAEYMVSALRDQALALACLRHGVPAREGRGMDLLPEEVTRPMEEALVRSIDRGEIARAFRVATRELLAEARRVDGGLASRLERPLLELSGDAASAGDECSRMA
jgi:hypothetical protein